MSEVARYIRVAGEPVEIGGGDELPPIEVVYETYLVGTGTHTYSSFPGVQAGDLILIFTGGAYRAVTITGMRLLADAGAGGATVTNSVFGVFATSSSPSAISFTFQSSNADNHSSMLILRGVRTVTARSAQAITSSNSTALTFPALSATGYLTRPAGEAFMLVQWVTGTPTFTISPTPVETIYSARGTSGGRNNSLFRLVSTDTYSATPSSATYKSGIVLEFL